MSEKPILMSAPMVRALLAGTKTQTRRAVKGAPADWSPTQPQVFSPTVIDRHGDEQPGPDSYGAGNEDGSDWIRCPYGRPGDLLRVRESFSGPYILTGLPPRDWNPGTPIYYWADGREPPNGDWTKPKPGMHMPMWASRITLEISEVRVQRLQEISEADARAEGAPGYEEGIDAPPPDDEHEWSYLASFIRLWESINGQGSWDANPWIWAVSFRSFQP